MYAPSTLASKLVARGCVMNTPALCQQAIKPSITFFLQRLDGSNWGRDEQFPACLSSFDRCPIYKWRISMNNFSKIELVRRIRRFAATPRVPLNGSFNPEAMWLFRAERHVNPELTFAVLSTTRSVTPISAGLNKGQTARTNHNRRTGLARPSSEHVNGQRTHWTSSPKGLSAQTDLRTEHACLETGCGCALRPHTHSVPAGI
jgi:hypothetical protein